tara:strand:- start:379 stop:702 length:324 start_codon:yes stop_codon:yes gene_type:complete
MQLELFEQMVRNDTSGGQMLKFSHSNPPNKKFIQERCGEQVKLHLEVSEGESNRLHHQFQHLPFHLQIKQVFNKLINITFFKEFIFKIILNDCDYQALKYGRFYLGG